ncbi:MAG: CARDB domain-containing protein [bacterium]
MLFVCFDFNKHAVLNNGDSPSAECRLNARCEDSERPGSELPNFVGRNGAAIPPLVPNATRVVTVRWDPIDNSGPHTILFKCDAYNRIIEKDEEDNIARLDINVHKKADIRIRTEDIKVQHSPDSRQFIIDFAVHNIGETDAPKVVIEITVGFEDGSPEQSAVLDVWQIPASEHRTAYMIKITDKAAWFQVTADPDEVIDEETHKNNSAKVSLTKEP